MRMLTRFVIVFASLSLLTACASSRVEDSATIKAICVTWGAHLGTKSVKDTQITEDETTARYAAFAAACPAFKDMIPE